MEGGGCAGFSYNFQMLNQKPKDDLWFEIDGVCVVSDEITLDMISGSKIV